MPSALIMDVFMPLVLATVMFALGLGLTADDFTRVVRYPRAALIGLATQSILLTAVAYAIARLFHLSPPLATGLMLLAASPGGAAACLYSHLARGDVALNLTLTAANCVLALVWMPAVVTWSMSHFFGAGQRVPPPTHEIFWAAAIIVAPVAAGMAVRAIAPEFCKKAEQPTRILAAVVLALLVAVLFAGVGSSLLQSLAVAGFACLTFNLVSLGVGFGIPMLARLPRPQATAIALEIGMHNGALALFVALSVLRDAAIGIPAVVYAVIMFLTGGAFAAWLGRRQE
jgi:BASS family bile acid:Na+ symporter